MEHKGKLIDKDNVPNRKQVIDGKKPIPKGKQIITEKGKEGKK